MGYSPVYGLIFLFKWQDTSSGRQTQAQTPETMFFAKQVGTCTSTLRACLTVLLLLLTLALPPPLPPLALPNDDTIFAACVSCSDD